MTPEDVLNHLLTHGWAPDYAPETRANTDHCLYFTYKLLDGVPHFLWIQADHIEMHKKGSPVPVLIPFSSLTLTDEGVQVEIKFCL